MHIETLPTELIIIILNYLNYFEIISCKSVSKRWKEIIDSKFKTKKVKSESIPIEYPNAATIFQDLILIPNDGKITSRSISEPTKTLQSVSFPHNSEPKKIYQVVHFFYAIYDNGVSIYNNNFIEVVNDFSFHEFSDDQQFIKNSFFDYDTFHLYAIDNYGCIYVWDHWLKMVNAFTPKHIFDPESIFSLYVSGDTIKFYYSFNEYYKVKIPIPAKYIQDFDITHSNPGIERFKKKRGEEYCIDQNKLYFRLFDNCYKYICDTGNECCNFAISDSYLVYIDHKEDNMFKKFICVKGLKNKSIVKKFEIDNDEILSLALYEYEDKEPHIILQNPIDIKVYSW